MVPEFFKLSAVPSGLELCLSRSKLQEDPFPMHPVKSIDDLVGLDLVTSGPLLLGSGKV